MDQVRGSPKDFSFGGESISAEGSAGFVRSGVLARTRARVSPLSHREKELRETFGIHATYAIRTVHAIVRSFRRKILGKRLDEDKRPKRNHRWGQGEKRSITSLA